MKSRKVKMRSRKLDNFRSDALLKHILLEGQIKMFLSLYFTKSHFHMSFGSLILDGDFFGTMKKISIIEHILRKEPYVSRLKKLYKMSIREVKEKRGEEEITLKEVVFKNGFSFQIGDFIGKMKKINKIRNHVAHKLTLADSKGKPLTTKDIGKVSIYEEGNEKELENSFKDVDIIFREFTKNVKLKRKVEI